MSKNERIRTLQINLGDLLGRHDSLRIRVDKLEAAPMAHADLEQRLKTLGEMEQRVRKLEVRLGEPPQAAPADEHFFKYHVPTHSINQAAGSCGAFQASNRSNDCMRFTRNEFESHNASIRSQALQDTNSDEVDKVWDGISNNDRKYIDRASVRMLIERFLAVRRGRL
jgi:hypothetical protein